MITPVLGPTVGASAQRQTIRPCQSSSALLRGAILAVKGLPIHRAVSVVPQSEKRRAKVVWTTSRISVYIGGTISSITMRRLPSWVGAYSRGEEL